MALNVASLTSKQSAFAFLLGTYVRVTLPRSVAPSANALAGCISAANPGCKSTDNFNNSYLSAEGLRAYRIHFSLFFFRYVCFIVLRRLIAVVFVLTATVHSLLTSACKYIIYIKKLTELL
jgi:hypothetical protein